VFVAGLDAHTRYVVVVVIDRMGELVLKPTRVRMGDAERLLTVLAPYRPLDAVMETSSAWPWLHEVLTGAGIQFVLAHARRLRAIAEANYKSDDIDAELLARMRLARMRLARMRLARLIPEVFPTPAAQREWATLLRHRATLVAHRTALVNRLHGQLHTRGLHLARGRLLTRAGRRWLRTEAWPHLSAEQRAVARSHLRVIAGLRPLIGAVDRRIAGVAVAIPEARLLMTIPGIEAAARAGGLCGGAAGRPLPDAGHLASYAGLVPRSKQSGERPVRHGGIPAGVNRWLRGALVRAVVSHVQHQPASTLTAYYQTQKARVGWPVARVAAARKLARVIHAMLRTGTPWTTPSTPVSLGPNGVSSTNRLPHPTA